MAFDSQITTIISSNVKRWKGNDVVDNIVICSNIVTIFNLDINLELVSFWIYIAPCLESNFTIGNR